MDIKFSCPYCEQSLTVDNTGAGEKISCPSCACEVLIPLDDNQSEREQLAKQRERDEMEKIRQSARLTVESHWRNFLFLVHIDKQKAFAAIREFERDMNMMYENLAPAQAAIFRQVIEEEREKLSNEYDRNPDALKTRLGLSNSMPAFRPYGNRQSMDELIVKTAVRATIWESIWLIFRMFR
jgi:hypothetical protein